MDNLNFDCLEIFTERLQDQEKLSRTVILNFAIGLIEHLFTMDSPENIDNLCNILILGMVDFAGLLKESLKLCSNSRFCLERCFYNRKNSLEKAVLDNFEDLEMESLVDLLEQTVKRCNEREWTKVANKHIFESKNSANLGEPFNNEELVENNRLAANVYSASISCFDCVRFKKEVLLCLKTFYATIASKAELVLLARCLSKTKNLSRTEFFKFIKRREKRGAYEIDQLFRTNSIFGVEDTSIFTLIANIAECTLPGFIFEGKQYFEGSKNYREILVNQLKGSNPVKQSIFGKNRTIYRSKIN